MNSRGDIVSIYNFAGGEVVQYTYDAYGKVLSTAYTQAYYTIAELNPLRYRGYVYDRETGLYYLQSRYYDPETCRFINEDIQLNIDTFNGFNQFAYCENNPIAFLDPNGKRLIVGMSVQDETSDERDSAVAYEYPAIEITQKLDNAMTLNANYMRAHLRTNKIVKADVVFITKVRGGGTWDLKSPAGWNLRSNRNYGYRGMTLRYDDVGNIHYGYVGRVMYSTETLLNAAGLVQFYSGTADFGNVWRNPLNPSKWDDERDQWAINYGCKLYDGGPLSWREINLYFSNH